MSIHDRKTRHSHTATACMVYRAKNEKYESVYSGAILSLQHIGIMYGKILDGFRQ
jgi:hypothetical protein